MYEKNNFQPGDMLYAHQLNSMDDKIYELDSTSTIPCNQNLLDNWDFSNPVNQRGQTQYTSSESGMFTIDRWKLSGAGNIVITPPTTSILYLKATTSGPFPLLYQSLNQDLVKYLAGRKVTLSIMAGGVSGNFSLSDSGGLAKDHRDVQIHDGLTSYTFEVSEDAQDCGVFIWSNAANSSMYIAAMKLELGVKQTLAHMENGNLVLNEIPDYDEQLRRCQRYYWAFKSTLNLTKYQSDGNKYIGVLQFPTEMHSNPSITYTTGAGTVQQVNANKQRIEFVGQASASNTSCYVDNITATVAGLGG